MTARPLIVAAVVAIPGAACSGDGADPTGPGVLVPEVSLPVPGAEYRGTGSHLFLDRNVELTCSSHGVFSDALEPPVDVGASVLSEYVATFVGELALEPPVVSSAVSHPLRVQARMAERITLTEVTAMERVFDTELLTFELQGAGMPGEVVVRESPDLASAGMTTITPTSDGLNLVESYYDVWLEISLDGGRSWNRAEATVRMTLGPS